MQRSVAAALVAAVSLTVALLHAGSARGVENESFGMTPHPEEVDGVERRTFLIPEEPGAAYEDRIRVYNRTDQDLDLTLYAADAKSGGDGAISVGFSGSDVQGVGRWIDLPRDSVSLGPRDEVILTFRVQVLEADPSPDLGAIVIENRAPGLAADLAKRLHIVVRTAPPNSPTTSTRVGPLLLRSPWIFLAVGGLVLAIVLIVVGARRARRPKDTIVEPESDEPDTQPEPVETEPRTVLRRLGSRGSKERAADVTDTLVVGRSGDLPPLEPPAPDASGDFVPLDEVLDEIRAEPEEDLGYIPLDDL